MNIASPRIQAALVVKWPHQVPLVAAREFCRRLIDLKLAATWSLDQASQVEALASWGAVRCGAEAALLLDGASGAANEHSAAQECARRLVLLRATGMDVTMVHASRPIDEGTWPRTLRALGILGVVADAAGADHHARALPFGVWQFAPAAEAPSPPRWFGWMRRRRPVLAGAGRQNSAIVTIDLARAGLPGSRPWCDAELAIADMRQAVTAGEASLETLGQMAARLGQTSAPRPQRSILRAAA